MTTPVSLTVVICVHTPRRWPQILDGVAAAREQLEDTDGIVVVVDHNDDLSARLRENYRGTGVVVVDNDRDRGLSGARTTGTAAASGDVVVFLDDDAAARPGALAAVRARFRDPRVHVVAGAVHPAWAGPTGRAPRWFPDEFGWVVGCDYRGLPGDGAQVRNPIGAAMAVRADVLAAVGGFDARLGRIGTELAGCEETLMGIRVRARDRGALLVRDSGFAVDHLVPRDRQSVAYLVRRCRAEGRSKAILSDLVGSEDALESERRFVRRVIPTGIVRGLARTLTGDLGGAARAVVIVVGCVATATGIVAGRLRRRTTTRTAPAVLPGAVPDARVPVSVVVPTVGRTTLPRTVRAILDQTHTTLEVVVVDNAPSTGRAERLLSDITDPRLTLVAEHRRGVSAARNTGVERSSGTVIAFTDDDACPDPRWVETIVESFAHDGTGTVHAVTGRVVGIDVATDEQAWFENAQIFDHGDRPVQWSLSDVDEDGPLGPAGERSAFFPHTCGDVGSGNNVAVRRDAFTRVGGFDLALGAGTLTRGGEDLDLFRRILRTGGTIAYVPDAVVGHTHRSDMEELRSQMFGYGAGLTAMLTKAMTTGDAAAVARLVPTGLVHMLHPDSERNAAREKDGPSTLMWVEVLGSLAGPALYARSVLALRRRGRPGPVDVPVPAAVQAVRR